MAIKPQSIFEKQISPFTQGLVVFGLIGIAIVISKIVSNCIFSFAYEDQNSYWWKSILTFALLGASGMCLAWWVSGLTLDEAGSFRWMALLFTFSYLVMLSMCRAMRMILKWAQKQGTKT